MVIFSQIDFVIYARFVWYPHSISCPSRPKIIFLFSGATFHIPLTKSATLNRLLQCSLWQFSGALLGFWGLLFAFRGRNRPEPPCNFFPVSIRWAPDGPDASHFEDLQFPFILLPQCPRSNYDPPQLVVLLSDSLSCLRSHLDFQVGPKSWYVKLWIINCPHALQKIPVIFKSLYNFHELVPTGKWN